MRSLPAYPAQATFSQVGDHHIVSLQRRLAYAPMGIWPYLTAPDLVALWSPFRPEREMSTPGPIRLWMLGGETESAVDGGVLEVESPRLLVYDWGGDVMRFEVDVDGDGAVLTCSQRTAEVGMLSMLAAGWHVCLGALELALDDPADVPAVAGMAAMNHGWAELEAAYQELLRR